MYNFKQQLWVAVFSLTYGLSNHSMQAQLQVAPYFQTLYTQGLNGDVFAMMSVNADRQEAGLDPLFSDSEVMTLLKPLADSGDPSAIRALSYFYRNGVGGLTQDEKKADELLKRSAELGDSDAMGDLAQILANKGKKEEALIFGKRATEMDLDCANKGNVECIYSMGKGVRLPGASNEETFQTQQQADDWLKKAISLGHGGAAFFLGNRLLTNSQTKGEFEEAWAYLNKSAELGEWKAMLKIGEYYYTGYEEHINSDSDTFFSAVPLDHAKAQEWFNKVVAAIGTDAPVQELIAMLEEVGPEEPAAPVKPPKVSGPKTKGNMAPELKPPAALQRAPRARNKAKTTAMAKPKRRSLNVN